jgi:hypothetical protein
VKERGRNPLAGGACCRQLAVRDKPFFLPFFWGPCFLFHLLLGPADLPNTQRPTFFSCRCRLVRDTSLPHTHTSRRRPPPPNFKKKGKSVGRFFLGGGGCPCFLFLLFWRPPGPADLPNAQRPTFFSCRCRPLFGVLRPRTPTLPGGDPLRPPRGSRGKKKMYVRTLFGQDWTFVHVR